MPPIVEHKGGKPSGRTPSHMPALVDFHQPGRYQCIQDRIGAMRLPQPPPAEGEPSTGCDAARPPYGAGKKKEGAMRNRFSWSAVLAALATLALASGAAAQRYPGHGWCMMDSWFGGVIMWILILLVIVLVVSLFVRTSRRTPTADETGRETPLDIIEKRYARGEISRAEFEEMKKDLSG